MIVKAYGKKFNLVQRTEPSSNNFQHYWDMLVERIPQLANYKFQIILALTCGSLLLACIIYFNMLTTADHAWQRSAGQVEVFMQRRNDISINLSKAVQGYSAYERTVMTEVVKLRSLIRPGDLKSGKLDDVLKGMRENQAAVGKDPVAGKDAAALMGSMVGLFAVAEQYPDLKLSANFQSLMAALIEVEKDLAQERVKLNEAIFAYAELTDHFPSRYFAALFGFKAPDYFKATQDARALNPVQF
ncbi:LemA family protein [Fundidesulfovibrio magnetotacticus]|nr:LemA family protein [Fundidesulfovibrio magnetotacticus]